MIYVNNLKIITSNSPSFIFIKYNKVYFTFDRTEISLQVSLVYYLVLLERSLLFS